MQKPALIFDAHLDMSWNALEFNRDLMKPVAEIREFEKQFTDINPGPATCSWGELQRGRSEEHTSELQSRRNLVCRLLLEKKNKLKKK